MEVWLHPSPRRTEQHWAAEGGCLYTCECVLCTGIFLWVWDGTATLSLDGWAGGCVVGSAMTHVSGVSEEGSRGGI